MRRLLLLSICLLAAFVSYADRVTEQQALEKAQQFMQGKSFTQFQGARRIKGTPQVAENQAFYVFNAEDNGGFVIVSGDDRTKEILGYGESGNLDMANLPENLKTWLDYYSRAITAISKSNKSAARQQTIPRASRNEIKPLIKTQWHQQSPFNDWCFIYGQQCATGCVATAMAQIMNYWQWPQSVGAIDGYTDSYGRYIDGLEATTFNWTNMTNEDYAKLCRYCGQSVKMNYGKDSSAPDTRAPGALVNIFGYDQGTHIIFREGYSYNEWEDMIYNELAHNRPVMYGGRSTSNFGHEFIVDGYKNGYFHVNWGWGGSRDNYFVLSVMNSKNTVDDTYSEQQTAFIGFQPACGGSANYPLRTICKMETGQDGQVVTRSSSGSNFPQVNVKWVVKNTYLTAMTSNYVIGLIQDNQMKYQLVTYNPSTTIPGNYDSHDIDIGFGANYANGTYRMEILNKNDNGGLDALVGYGKRYIEVVIDGNSMRLKNYYPAEADNQGWPDWPDNPDNPDNPDDPDNPDNPNNSDEVKCDVNGDKVLDENDIYEIAYNILHLKPISSFNAEVADLNKDNVVDIFDLVMAINLLYDEAGARNLGNLRDYKGNEPQLQLISKALSMQEAIQTRQNSNSHVRRAETKENYFTIEDLCLYPGEEKLIPILLYNKETFTAFQCELHLPTGVTVSEIYTGYNVPDNTGIHFSYSDNSNFQYIAIPWWLEEIPGTSGDIMWINVKAGENLEPGTLTGKFFNVKLAKADGTGFTDTEGTTFPVTILSYEDPITAGDANGDGTVNAADIVEVVNYIMGSPSAGFNEKAADVNGDGVVNAADIVSIVNIIMGG